jgi:catechol 2,3-dioxygenase-like lactoylglutathione lyase family enzyme
MRIDHLALRVADRNKTAEFLMEAFGYTKQVVKVNEDGSEETEFEIIFDDGQKAKCIALEPPEKATNNLPWRVWSFNPACLTGDGVEYHLAPEIFVSDGTPGSIVGDWVVARGGIGGLHHIAFQVDSVKETMMLWKEKGWAEFTSEEPVTCPGLTQVFSVPHALTGIVFEFIERGEHGFCRDNVKALMESSRNFK